MQKTVDGRAMQGRCREGSVYPRPGSSVLSLAAQATLSLQQQSGSGAGVSPQNHSLSDEDLGKLARNSVADFLPAPEWKLAEPKPADDASRKVDLLKLYDETILGIGGASPTFSDAGSTAASAGAGTDAASRSGETSCASAATEAETPAAKVQTDVGSFRGIRTPVEFSRYPIQVPDPGTPGKMKTQHIRVICKTG